MKASLQLKMGQHLTMTPQLQQAIRLLQLSSLELQQEIQQALDSNPLLEIEDEFSEAKECTPPLQCQVQAALACAMMICHSKVKRLKAYMNI